MGLHGVATPIRNPKGLSPGSSSRPPTTLIALCHFQATRSSSSSSSKSTTISHTQPRRALCLLSRPRRRALFTFKSPRSVSVRAALDSASPLANAAQQLVDDFLRSSMVVGVGGGTGALLALQHLSSKLKTGALKDITLVPASALIAAEIAGFGIPMTSLEEMKKTQQQLDVAFCDADTVQEGTLYAIIGRKDMPGRGSLVKEKALARAAKQFLLLVDSSNFCDKLNGSVPVEIEQTNWLDIAEEVDDVFIGDAEVWRRPFSGEAGPMGGDFPFVTEGGHFVLDLRFDAPLDNPENVAKELSSIPGVVEHGVLLNEAYAAAVAYSDGVKIRTSLFRTSFAT